MNDPVRFLAGALRPALTRPSGTVPSLRRLLAGGLIPALLAVSAPSVRAQSNADGYVYGRSAAAGSAVTRRPAARRNPAR